MAEYLIELPHTKAECMKAVDEISEKGSEFLSKVYWGCARKNPFRRRIFEEHNLLIDRLYGC